MRKLLTPLLLSVVSLTASANVWVENPGFEYDNPIVGQGAQFVKFELIKTTHADFTLSYMSVTDGQPYYRWVDVICNGCDNLNANNGGLYLPPNDAALIFKLEADGNTYYAGVKGYDAGAIFNLDGTGKTFVSFGSFGTSDFTFTMQNVRQGSLQNLTAIPEPETYAMLLAGLGMIGAVARRREQ